MDPFLATHHMIFGSRPSRFRRGTLGQPAARCPRRKLTLLTLGLTAAVLASPLLTPGGSFVQTAAGSDTLLAIDSPTFAVNSVALTEDGFMIKSSAQTNAADRSELSDTIAYTVEPGDTLGGIAHRFGVSTETVMWANDITNPNRLKEGMTLKILPVSGVSHAVAAGDTIASLAKKYGVEAEKIAKQNQLAPDGTLLAGAELIIPGGKKLIAAPTYVAHRGTYAANRAVGGAIVVDPAPKNANKWMVKPTNGIYTTYFRSGHYAVDIANRAMPAIKAAAAGTVIKSQCGWNGGYGCMIVIDHGDGIQTLYGHMSKLAASVGDKVGQGDQIGTMGRTGRVYGATGIHLHFEVIADGRKKNPLAYYAE